jgi:sporulation protein YlmC with PRC-barrel domain
VKQNEVRFEDLIGKVVCNEHGRAIGRLEDLRIEPHGNDYLVTEFLLGPLEPLPRLLAFASQLPTLRALGIGRKRRLHPVRWQWIDLSDLERPRLVGESLPRAGPGLRAKRAVDEDESG